MEGTEPQRLVGPFFRGFGAISLDPDHDLAEVRSGAEVLIRGGRVGKREGSIDHRRQLRSGDRSIQRLEHFAAPDVDSIHVEAPNQDGDDFHSSGEASEDADEREAASHAEGRKRLLKRAGTADLDHAIDANTPVASRTGFSQSGAFL